MARVIAPFVKPIREWDGLAKALTRRGSRSSQDATIEQMWRRLKPLRDELDRVESPAPQGFTWPRSTLLAFQIVALLEGLDICAAHVRVQECPRLRVLFGLAAPAPGIVEAVAEPGAEIHEAGFPPRRTVSHFLTWMHESAAAGEIFERAAYETPLLEAVREHDVDLHKTAVDGTRVLSSRRSNSGKRPDTGAVWTKHDKEPWKLARNKVTFLLADMPIVAASVIGGEHEIRLFEDELLPQLNRRALRLNGHDIPDDDDLSARLGLFAGAAVAGDRHFAGENQVAALKAHGLLGLSRPAGDGEREIIGTRALTNMSGEKRDFEICADGTVLCPCDEAIPLRQRLPCEQQSQGTDRDAVWIKCSHTYPEAHRRERFSLTFRRPDRHLYDGAIVEPGEPTLTLHTHVPRSDVRAQAILHKALQAIEHYHSGLFENFALNPKHRKGRQRRVVGEQPVKMLYLLGDLVWNNLVLLNATKAKAAKKVRPILCPHGIASRGWRKDQTIGAKKGSKQSEGPPRLTGPPPAEHPPDRKDAVPQ